ncbi:hypothetical protein PsYK624_066220 [Phanerochaete sordida]|uniref:Uncharacterized protein n=1 Tax=Phanerochaete sordida TaxID=48140 RepID=A0A9P3GAU0_9APHY|nr:hypothetical protein PsYK624_066220 [Phanerochaete sordida]
MRFNAGFLLLASMVAFASQTFALSVRVADTDVPASVVAPTHIAKRDAVAFTHGENAVMAPHDVALVRRASWTYKNNQALILAIIAKNAYVINATCSSGNVITCAIGVTYSVFTFFFASWLWADRRAAPADGAHPTFVFGPTPAQTLRQRVADLPVLQWHYLGHVQHAGANHTVHYFGHGGGVHQLRATTAPFWNATLGARDENDDGGFVGDYYWNSDNEGAYDAFHSTGAGTTYFADNAAGYMVNSQQAVSACAGFQDADGYLDNGILTYGWNNEPYEWADGQLDAQFGRCESELGDGPQ